MTTLTTTRTGHETTRSGLKTAGLMAVTPLIGLAYIVLMPLAGLLALAWFARRALAPRRETVKTIGLMLVAPLYGLAYILLFPLAGLATLATLEVRRLAPTGHVAA